jgi:hypothetical protein
MMTLPITLAGRFTCTIEALLKVVADLGNRRRMHGPLLIAIWNRIRRLSTRFLRLWALYQAGKLRPPRVRARPAAARPERPPRSPSLLPAQRFLWLVKLIQETAGFGVMLGDLLRTEPEIEALVQTAPQAGRVLRPLCAMLGLVPPEWLRLPPRPRRARKPRAASSPSPARRALGPRDGPSAVGADVTKLSSVAYGHFLHPENEKHPVGIRPPNRIGYARSRWPPKNPD